MNFYTPVNNIVIVCYRNFVHKIVRRLPHQSYGKLFMDSEEKHSIGVRFDLSYAEDRLQFWLCHIIVERSTRYDCVIKEDFQVDIYTQIRDRTNIMIYSFILNVRI